MNQGKIIIISAPSGSGKSSIVAELMKTSELKLAFSVSATTRPPRGTETNGKEYYFMTEDDFKAAIARDEFAEFEEVYPGRYYGTLKSEIARISANGLNTVLDIDVKGGVNVKRMYGDSALSLFIQPPSVEVLRSRLNKRGTDVPEEIEKRVSKAAYELTFAEKFDHVVVNDEFDKAVSEAREFILDFLRKQ